ncbi:MAG: hypothetical protein KA472_11425 [Pseudomonadales bacterium]|nr:hypothetical protein [Pseudomonadales bacterium]
MNAGAEIHKVPRDLVDEAWLHARCLIDRGRAVAPNLLNEGTLQRLRDTTLQLWFVLERGELLAVFFTDVQATPTGQQVLCVQGLGGRQMWRWSRRMQAEMIRFARHHNCDAVRFVGRKAYERLFEDVRILEPASDGQSVYERAIQ